MAILVVNEDVEFHLLIKRIFRDDAEVHTAPNVRDATRILNRTKIDVVLLEVAVRNGWDFLRRWGNRSTPYVVVVTVEGNAVRRRAMEYGAAEVFVQPFVPSQLRRFVLGLLRR
jgi:DNA-binding response OmpR family regulator